MASGQPAARQPDFLFVCGHGFTGAPLDRVCLLPWFADRPGWWAAKGVDEAAIGVWPMEGAGRRGWDLKWLRPEWHHPEDPDLRREAIEIRCPDEHCTTWAYRSDDARLQTLLATIAADGRFRTAVTVSADEKLIVMKLQALHLARNTVRTKLRLNV